MKAKETILLDKNNQEICRYPSSQKTFGDTLRKCFHFSWKIRLPTGAVLTPLFLVLLFTGSIVFFIGFSGLLFGLLAIIVLSVWVRNLMRLFL